MKILFFHGGPGLNSNPENKLLSESFAEAGFDLVCWNEPSALRPQGPVPAVSPSYAYDRYLESAEQFFMEHYEGKPLVVMAHSFGANAACYVAQKHPEKIAKIIFVSTDLVPSVADENIFRFVSMDYKEFGDSRYQDLQKVINEYTGKFDQNTEAGFGLVVQNPRWFDYYWFNRTRLAAFGPHYGEPGFTVDVDGFFNTRRSHNEVEMSPVDVPVAAIFGKHDIVVTRDIELSVLSKRFRSVKVHDLELSGHYPHVEETEEFLRLLRAELPREEAKSSATSALF